MRVCARASGCDAHCAYSPIPTPAFSRLAKTSTDTFSTYSVFHDKPANECKGWRLEAMLNRDFNPADDFIAQTGYEGGLSVADGANIFNPPQDFRLGAVVAELLDQGGDCRCIARLDRPDDHLRIAAASRRVAAAKPHIHGEHIRMRPPRGLVKLAGWNVCHLKYIVRILSLRNESLCSCESTLQSAELRNGCGPDEQSLHECGCANQEVPSIHPQSP